MCHGERSSQREKRNGEVQCLFVEILPKMCHLERQDVDGEKQGAHRETPYIQTGKEGRPASHELMK